MEWPKECESYLPKKWEVIGYNDIMLRERNSLQGIHYVIKENPNAANRNRVDELIRKSFKIFSCSGPRASANIELATTLTLTEYQRDQCYAIKANPLYYNPSFGWCVMGNLVCGHDLTIPEMVVFKTLFDKVFKLKLWLTHPSSVDHKRAYQRFLELCNTLARYGLLKELGNHFVRLDILPNRVVMEVKFHCRLNPIAINLHNSELFYIFDDLLGLESNCKVELAEPTFTIK